MSRLRLWVQYTCHPQTSINRSTSIRPPVSPAPTTTYRIWATYHRPSNKHQRPRTLNICKGWELTMHRRRRRPWVHHCLNQPHLSMVWELAVLHHFLARRYLAIERPARRDNWPSKSQLQTISLSDRWLTVLLELFPLEVILLRSVLV